MILCSEILCLLLSLVIFSGNATTLSSGDGVSVNCDSESKSESKSKFDDSFFDNLDLLENNGKYSEVIDVCLNILNRQDIEYYNEIDILIRLGDAYFASGNNKKAIEVYMLLLNKYVDFNGLEDVLYNLCCAVYRLMPKNPNVDLEYCEKMINYGNYSLSKIKKIEYSDSIRSMIDEAKDLIELKEFNDIKFFYENEIFPPALHCCNKFLETYNDDKYRNLVISYKIDILYNLAVKLISFLKMAKKSVCHDVLRETYDKIIGYYNELKSIGRSVFDLSDKSDRIIKKLECEISNIN